MVSSVGDIATKFYSLGLALGLQPSALDKINSGNFDDALRNVIKEWLTRANLIPSVQSVKPSWRVLVRAVDDRGGGGNPALAETIAAAHPGRQILI